MAKLKGVHQSKKDQYGAYQARAKFKTNKVAKLKRHLKNHPEDAVAQAALKQVPDSPKRKTPKSRMWSSQTREAAQMLARVGINGNHALGGKVSAEIGDGEDKRYFGDEKYDKWQRKRWEEEDKRAEAARKAGRTPKAA